MPRASRACDRLLDLEAVRPEDEGPELQAARQSYEAEFHEARQELSQTILAVASRPRFREAVSWQNHRAMKTGIDRLLAMDPPDGRPNRKRRRREQLVASYLQRYSTKNDTIGFFGPFSWIVLDAQLPQAARIEVGPRLVSRRRVFFESWALDAMAAAIARDEALEPWWCPRRFPYLHVEGLTVATPTGERHSLSPQEATVLTAANGDLTARELARGLVADPAHDFDDEAEVFAVLARLVAGELCTWTLELPKSLQPERDLLDRLERIEDEALRRRVRAPVDALVSGRDAVADAAGDPAALHRALGELAATFRSATGRAARRAAGKTYAGRTLVYEECRRDLVLELGADFLSVAERPLTLLLTGARWLAHELTRAFSTAAAGIHDELLEKSGAAAVPLLAFWRRATPLLLPDERNPMRTAVLRGYRERWSRLLEWEPGTRRVDADVEKLELAVLAAFDSPGGCAWQLARCHSPDLMIAARGTAALLAGDFELVLGELHPAINTLRHPGSANPFLDDPEILAECVTDLPGAPVIPVLPKPWSRFDAPARLGVPLPGTSIRLNPRLVPGPHLHLEFGSDPPGAPPERRLPVGELVVRRRDEDGALTVATRDGRRSFDLVEFFSYPLSVQLVSAGLGIAPPHPHTPRIRFDRLIVSRETWRFRAGELDIVGRSESERFLAARRWAREHGLPRALFASVPLEIKPLFVDLESPLSIELFTTALGRAAAERPDGLVVVSEMLPDLDQAWLPDTEGNLYTSEIRCIAVDGGPLRPRSDDE